MGSYKAILQGLSQAAEKWPELSGTVRLYTELLEAQAQVSVPLPALTLPDEAAIARLR